MEMIKNQQVYPKMHSTYYLKPGQTLKNTKVSERPLMLVIAKSAYNKMVKYTNESERLAALAEKEAVKLAAIKKATYEMSKTWDNTVENMKRRREEELLAKRKQDEANRLQFFKDMAAKNAAEHAAIVEEARRLLFYRKPQCRLFNRALLTSECFRERDAQMAFQKTLGDIDKESDKEYINLIKKDVENHQEEERQKAIERSKKDKAFGVELMKQLEANRNDSKRMEMQELEAEKQDLKNMARDLQVIKECEIEETVSKKRELKKLFMDAVEQKKRYELKVKRDEEFQDQALEIFVKAKRRMEKLQKLKVQEERDEKARRADFIAQKCAVAQRLHKAEEEERIRRAIEEKEAVELARIEARKKYETELRANIEKFKSETVVAKQKLEFETANLRNWETLQRFKRDEYNKEFELNELKRQWNKKMDNAKALRQQIAEKRAERKRNALLENDSIQMKDVIEKTNEEILAYGEQILEESKGVRPHFPIIKAIQQFKKETGLIPQKRYEEISTPAAVRRQRKVRPCLNSLPEEKLFYL